MTDDTPTTAPLPAAGWYPAPHANGEPRYWDGTRWAEQTPDAAMATATNPHATHAAVTTPDAAQTTVLPQRTDADAGGTTGKKGLRWWVWLLIGLGALILIVGIIGALNGGGTDASDDTSDRPAAAAPSAPVVEEIDTTVDTPDVVGSTVSEARAALSAVGLTLVTNAGAGEDWLVTTQTVVGPVEPGTEVSVVAEAPQPVLTTGQENAVAKGQSYLSLMGFSRSGLIDQLMFEGYSAEDATFAADFIAPDWNNEAAEKAQSYMDTMAFSRDGLIEQLLFEGFDQAQAEYGAAAVGY